MSFSSGKVSFFIHLISIGYLPHAKHSCWEHISEEERTSCAHEKDCMKNYILICLLSAVEEIGNQARKGGKMS